MSVRVVTINSMNSSQRAAVVQRLALQAGFERVGMVRAEPLPRQDYVAAWLERGWAGEMDYLRQWRELRGDPRQLLEGARSVIVVAHNYRQSVDQSPKRQRGTGRVAQYAWGRDYHKVIRKKLRVLVKAMRAEMDEPFEARICVDTAPLIERELAMLAGIGWIGKNTMVLHQDLGSFFFLGEIVTTLELAASEPATDHCGTCTRCLEACPTGALIGPYRMDATRCISYLTIEHRSEIAAELQPMMQDWVYGCDICQEVCPFNQEAPVATEPAYQSSARNRLAPQPLLADLLNLTAEQYQEQLAGSAMKRATPAMLKRNAEIAAGNTFS